MIFHLCKLFYFIFFKTKQKSFKFKILNFKIQIYLNSFLPVKTKIAVVFNLTTDLIVDISKHFSFKIKSLFDRPSIGMFKNDAQLFFK